MSDVFASGDDSSRQRKASPAAHTLEAVAGIDRKISAMAVKIDVMAEQLIKTDSKHVELETRVRALELANARSESADTKSSNIWLFVWTALMGVATISLNVLSYLK